MMMCRAHSFPQAVYFRAKPQNFPLWQNFHISVEFCRNW